MSKHLQYIVSKIDSVTKFQGSFWLIILYAFIITSVLINWLVVIH